MSYRYFTVSATVEQVQPYLYSYTKIVGVGAFAERSAVVLRIEDRAHMDAGVIDQEFLANYQVDRLRSGLYGVTEPNASLVGAISDGEYAWGDFTPSEVAEPLPRTVTML